MSGDSAVEAGEYDSSSGRTKGLQDEDSADQIGEGKDDADAELLEGLTPELEKVIITIITDFEQESYPVWRFLNRDFFEAESFW